MVVGDYVRVVANNVAVAVLAVLLKHFSAAAVAVAVAVVRVLREGWERDRKGGEVGGTGIGSGKRDQIGRVVCMGDPGHRSTQHAQWPPQGKGVGKTELIWVIQARPPTQRTLAAETSRNG